MTFTLLSLRTQRPGGTKNPVPEHRERKGHTGELGVVAGLSPCTQTQQRSLIGESGLRALGLAAPGVNTAHSQSVEQEAPTGCESQAQDCRPRAAFSLLLFKPSQCRPRPLPTETGKNNEHTPACGITQPCQRMPESSRVFV